MEEKRYAIVRVDNCPSKFEKGFNDYFVCDGRGKDMRLGKDKIICSNCRYGDTKEQLIKKVAQILFQESPHNVLYTNPDKVVNEFFYNDCLKTATKIVKFLGVE